VIRLACVCGVGEFGPQFDRHFLHGGEDHTAVTRQNPPRQPWSNFREFSPNLFHSLEKFRRGGSIRLKNIDKTLEPKKVFFTDDLLDFMQ
jgi:hypothetical protein